ncbi:MAG: 2-phospho-L-lactate guanylyltransferase [Anaerolineae bacterium]
MSRIAAIVPAKPLARAKTRLGDTLNDAERADVAARLLERVLAALHAARGIDSVWVVGGDEQVRDLAARHGAEYIEEPGHDLNESLSLALDRLPSEVTHALLLPMDLPFLTGEALDLLIDDASQDGTDVLIAPDRWGHGTNALLVVRPFRLQPAFGVESLARHLAAAASEGLAVAVFYSRDLAFDIDTPADLAEAGIVPPLAPHPPTSPPTSAEGEADPHPNPLPWEEGTLLLPSPVLGEGPGVRDEGGER